MGRGGRRQQRPLPRVSKIGRDGGGHAASPFVFRAKERRRRPDGLLLRVSTAGKEGEDREGALMPASSRFSSGEDRVTGRGYSAPSLVCRGLGDGEGAALLPPSGFEDR